MKCLIYFPRALAFVTHTKIDSNFNSGHQNLHQNNKRFTREGLKQ